MPQNPNQPCPGVLQVDINMEQDGQKIANTFHVLKQDLDYWTRAQMDEMGAVFQTWWVERASQHINESVKLMGKTLTDLKDLNGLRVFYGEDNPPNGQTTGEVFPQNATIAVKLVVTNRGRGRNGRIFWPGLDASLAQANRLTDAAGVAIVGHIDNLIGVVQAAPTSVAALCVLSRTLAGAPRPQGIGYNISRGALSDLTLDSQKNRLPNHKRRKIPHTP